MKTTIEIELKPFTVPNFVIPITPKKRIDDGFQEFPSLPLSDVDADTLWKMCRDFTDAVFQKAGKQQPPRQV